MFNQLAQIEGIVCLCLCCTWEVTQIAPLPPCPPWPTGKALPWSLQDQLVLHWTLEYDHDPLVRNGHLLSIQLISGADNSVAPTKSLFYDSLHLSVRSKQKREIARITGTSTSQQSKDYSTTSPSFTRNGLNLNQFSFVLFSKTCEGYAGNKPTRIPIKHLQTSDQFPSWHLGNQEEQHSEQPLQSQLGRTGLIEYIEQLPSHSP